ncbi:DNA-directed RNA polymerase II subunit RPB2 [Myotis davidii]|uniref:DNA-directed RNA polymerase II subunit RPB2 n=1 Tax=Myotis davidii TaxID=225400 RepID=L5M7W8_MYODS|nr:DNA-directed RNA polymerase II subunit RPB2 [Myotis davidii]
MSVQRIVEDAPPIDLQAEAQHASGEVEEPRGKEKEREIETSMMRIIDQLPPTRSTPEIEPITRACALTGN